MRATQSFLWALVLAAALAAGPVAAGETPCVGDCNGDGMVGVNEMIIGVNIVLGTLPPSACPAFQNAQGEVNVSQLIQGVNNLLNGCNGMPTPTPTTRVFEIDPGVLLAPPSGTASGIFTTGLSGANAAQMISNGPLRIEMGAPGPDGVAPLTLGADVTVEVLVVDNSRLCLQMFAANSSGSIDCDGGTAYDILATRPSLAPGIAFDVETGLGEPSGPGNANLLVEVLFQLVPASDATPCDDVVYENPIQIFGFTTTNGTSVVEGTVLTLTVPGQPFDCEEFGTPGSGGQLAAPAPANQNPIGDVANVFRFGEAP